jgi:ABC-type transporter Mla maintaining outer membrane lipid asymmetry ATPase subunit MlaF
MIEVRSLTKRFGRTVAVDDLSFAMSPGRVTGFLGPNGSGKSTTMRVILGLALPTKGSAQVNGRPYRALRAPLRQVGSMFDARAVHGVLPVVLPVLYRPVRSCSDVQACCSTLGIDRSLAALAMRATLRAASPPRTASPSAPRMTRWTS